MEYRETWIKTKEKRSYDRWKSNISWNLLLYLLWIPWVFKMCPFIIHAFKVRQHYFFRHWLNDFVPPPPKKGLLHLYYALYNNEFCDRFGKRMGTLWPLLFAVLYAVYSCVLSIVQITWNIWTCFDSSVLALG